MDNNGITIKIQNKKIINFAELSAFIPSCFDGSILISLSNQLSNHIRNNNIDAIDADNLFSLIKTQLYSLGSSGKNMEKGKRYTINPTNRPTYLQSREGNIYISLLILNISIITVMFTLIAVARFIK